MDQLISLNYMSVQKQKFLAGLRLKNINDPLITRTDLIVHAKLTSGNGNYKLELNRGTSVDTDGQIRLGKEEFFFPTHLAMAVGKFDEDDENNDGKPVFHYVDLNVFNGTNEAKALNAIFNGKVNLKVNTIDILSEIATRHLRFTPPVQYQSAAASLQQIEMPQFGPTIEERGYYPLHNDAMLSGDDSKNMLMLESGTEDLSAIEGTDATLKNRVTFFVHGFRYLSQFASQGTSVCIVR